MNAGLLRKHGKKFLVLLVVAVAFSVIGQIWDYFDSSLKGAEHLLTTSSDIRDRVGSGLVYSRYKSYYFSATGNQPAYREYLFIVKGDKMKGRVTIRVDLPTEAGGKEHYSLVEIRPDD
jgi:hypothetical protein